MSFLLFAILVNDDKVLSDIPVQIEKEFALNWFLASKTEKLFISILLAPLNYYFYIRSFFERDIIISKLIK